MIRLIPAILLISLSILAIALWEWWAKGSVSRAVNRDWKRQKEAQREFDRLQKIKSESI